MSGHPVLRALTKAGAFTASPWAFLILALYTLGWIVVQRESLDWHGFASLAAWLMTLFIQRAAHRDTQALHAKLDELLRADASARTRLGEIDLKEPEEIEALRKAGREA